MLNQTRNNLQFYQFLYLYRNEKYVVIEKAFNVTYAKISSIQNRNIHLIKKRAKAAKSVYELSVEKFQVHLDYHDYLRKRQIRNQKYVKTELENSTGKLQNSEPKNLTYY